MLDYVSDVQLTLIIGRYARDWHLPDRASESLTETIKDWEALAPTMVALPHPSPRNNRWLKQHPWFATDLLPRVQARIREALG